MRFKFLSLFSLTFLLSSSSFAGFPSPQGRVNDFAGVLDAGAKAHLLATLHGVESKTGDEIAVVTVSSLDGMTVEDYAVQLFKKWGIGKKKKDNGLLVLVCPPEHKVRIEVGYGLEPTVTDGLAGSIIRGYFTPAFKKGDYAGGLTAGVDHLAKILTGEEPASPETLPDFNPPDTAMDLGTQIGLTCFLSLFVWIGFTFLGMGLGSRVGFGVFFGFFFGGVPLLMLFLFPELAGWPRTTVLGEAAAAAVLGLWLGIKYPKALKGKAGKGGSGWGSGGFSSGSSSSDSSSSSDDSFGGGGSGGGGASGSW